MKKKELEIQFINQVHKALPVGIEKLLKKLEYK